ncbi:hypothetical protein C1646_694192 [Rhizophagus diaphanus]|nr:hypothetical protein C1646_694192 [Rhizophagus diaphanus] [Rhizophagus sp. MUCL 43196]
MISVVGLILLIRTIWPTLVDQFESPNLNFNVERYSFSVYHSSFRCSILKYYFCTCYLLISNVKVSLIPFLSGRKKKIFILIIFL